MSERSGHNLENRMNAMIFQDVVCALCGPGVGHRVLYPRRLDLEGIDSGQLFSARRIPGRVHFQIVTCEQCGLVYSNPIFSDETIQRLYAGSVFIDDLFLKSQYVNIQNDYARHLKKAASYLVHTESLLDIGCGSGFFLKIAKEQGFSDVRGVEPGRDACAKAEADVRHLIVESTFRRELFNNNMFDLVSAFHVLDHVLSPNIFLDDIRQVLKPRGIILLVAHNVRFIVTRLAGESAPMFHIEHVYLFDKKTARMILEKNGFEVLHIEDLSCTYTLAHAIKMMPFPLLMKKWVLGMLEGKSIADIRIKLSPGDMLLIARKSAN